MNSRRILILTWRDLAHPQAGGAEEYTEQVAKRWAAAGHRVTVFSAAVDGRPADEIVNGYRVVRRGSRFTVYRQARTWYRQYGTGKFDVIVDMVNTVPYSAHRWITDGTPIVGFFHQTAEDVWNSTVPQPAAWLGRHVLEPSWIRGYRGRPVLVVSQSTADAVARFGVTDTLVLPEGFDPPPVLPQVAKESRPTVAWMARLVAYKQPDHMLAAARIVAATYPDVQVWLMGGGPMLDRLRADAPPSVQVLGRVSEEDKLDRMARAHVHVATSLREGWGLVVTEAAALGTPTIAYNTPGLRDSTTAARGQLCPPNPEALAAFLVGALPQLMTQRFPVLPYGGAQSWDTVADTMWAALDRATPARTRKGPAR